MNDTTTTNTFAQAIRSRYEAIKDLPMPLDTHSGSFSAGVLRAKKGPTHAELNFASNTKLSVVRYVFKGLSSEEATELYETLLLLADVPHFYVYNIIFDALGAPDEENDRSHTRVWNAGG